MNRRTLVTGSAGFAVSAFTTPTIRWLSEPADRHRSEHGGRRVGQGDIDELRETAEDARRWDAKYGGGNWKLSSINDCLDRRASPLLHGSYTEDVGRQLFVVTAELARLVGWSAFDMGRHDVAQRQFVQALRMAKAAGDVEIGCYVLTTMALAALIKGAATEAVDMAEGARNRAKDIASPRVLSFAKPAEARAHAKAGNGPAAARALSRAEDLLAAVRDDGRDPQWLDYYTRARLASDATEIHLDLVNPRSALAWSTEADAMPSGRYTRATGIRLAVTASAHLQRRDLDQGLAVGRRALGILGGVESSRARDYLRQFARGLGPWEKDPLVRAFLLAGRPALHRAA